MNSFDQLVGKLSTQEGRTALLGMLRGIEREALRIDTDGHLGEGSHPKALGSALTHSRITTDYSESLLEFITPVENDITTLLDGLTKTQAFTVQNLNGQMLWPVSMPCYVGDIKDIPIAQYGSSNAGKMKTLYRQGLTHRYGALMQIISGVHFNFSVSQSLWDTLYEDSDKQLAKCDFISESYLGMIRNYRRLVWVLPYLFGASPAICGSFIKDKPTDLPFKKMGKGTLYLPYATSLRMSDLGYTNKEQEKLSISYNSLNEYLQGIKEAIKMPSANFAQIGIKVDGQYRQLNDYVLQIENELYSPIRAKRVARNGEKPSQALARAGVEYIEVRALDVNPFSVQGIDASQVRFLDLFLLYCLLTPSAISDEADTSELSANLKAVVLEGRKPELMLSSGGKDISLTQWLLSIFEQLKPLAELLDGEEGNEYQAALETWYAAVVDPSQTISGRMITEMMNNSVDHGCWVMKLTESYQQQMLAYPLSADDIASFTQESTSSLMEQQTREQAEVDQGNTDFDLYLERYMQE